MASDARPARVLTRQTVVLSVGAFIVMLGLSLVVPILPLYAREFGVSRTAAGALVSSFAVARLAFDLAGGVLADRFGARRVMLVGAWVLVLSSVGAALAPNYAVLLVTRVLEGVGSAAFATSANQLLVITTPGALLGRTIAVYQTGILSGISIGPIVGGQAAELGDFTTPFWIYAGLGVLVVLLVGRFVESGEPQGRTLRQVFSTARVVVRRPAFVALMVVTFCIFIFRAGARLTLLPLYAGEELGLDESDIGVILASAAIVNVLVVNPGGWLVDRIGRRPVLVTGLVLTAAATAATGFLDTFASLVVLFSASGVAAALASIPPPTLAGDLAPEGAVGVAVGVYRSAGDVGLIVGPLVVGAAADADAFTTGFVLVGVLLVVAAVIAAFIPETREGRPLGEAPVEP
ncbi:MAG: MFS transporter [Acidimicrobiia bacterium]|nr:MFS transporter [Acidimicrobiia bacterium]